MTKPTRQFRLVILFEYIFILTSVHFSSVAPMHLVDEFGRSEGTRFQSLSSLDSAKDARRMPDAIKVMNHHGIMMM